MPIIAVAFYGQCHLAKLFEMWPEDNVVFGAFWNRKMICCVRCLSMYSDILGTEVALRASHCNVSAPIRRGPKSSDSSSMLISPAKRRLGSLYAPPTEILVYL